MMATPCVVLLLLLPLTVLGQVPQCTLNGDFAEQTTGRYVYPRTTCDAATNTLDVQMFHNHGPVIEVEKSSYVDYVTTDVFYWCTNNEGMVRADSVPGLSSVVLNSDKQKVMLNETFLKSGASCIVLGCWKYNNRPEYYAIRNNTCDFEPVVSTPMTTSLLDTSTPSLVDTTTSQDAPDVSSTPIVQSTIILQSMTAPVILTPSVTSSLILPSKTPTAAVPDSGSKSRDQALTAVFLVIFLCIVVATILVLVGILLKVRHTQRKKKSIMRYYNYSEPIDPYFSPIDIHAQIKEALSVLSVFDTFSPYLPHPDDDSDDNRSEVLQGTGQTEENSSIKSIVFKDDSGVVLRSHPPPEEANKISASDEVSIHKEPPELTMNSAQTDCLSPDESQQRTSTVSNGYVVERAYYPSIVTIQSPVAGEGYVQHTDATCVTPVTLNLNQTDQKTSQLHTQRSCSTSSGYVTDSDTMQSSSGYVTDSNTIVQVPSGYMKDSNAMQASVTNSNATMQSPGGYVTDSTTMQAPSGSVFNSKTMQSPGGYVTDSNRQHLTLISPDSNSGYVIDSNKIDSQPIAPLGYVIDSISHQRDCLPPRDGYVHKQVSPESPNNSSYVTKLSTKEFHTQENSISTGYVTDLSSQAELSSPGCSVSEPSEQDYNTQSQPSPCTTRGYVVEKVFQAQLQSPSSGYVADLNKQNTQPTPPSSGFSVIDSSKQFHTQLSSASSGYVTGPNTPESSVCSIGLSPTMSVTTGVPVVNVQPSNKHTLLENSYTFVLSRSTRHKGLCKDPEVHSSVKDQDSENVVTECSLSINPLHFEPVNYDELMHGQTSPSYVNTA